LFEQTFAIEGRVLGDEHPTTLLTKRTLAISYLTLGHTQEAVTLQERALAICRRVLGDEHPATLASMRELASSYAELDRFAEARALFEEALATYRRVFGEQSVVTAYAMNDYALILLTFGPEERRNENAGEALGLAERACTLVGKSADADWDSLGILALAQHLTGDTEKASRRRKGPSCSCRKRQLHAGNMKDAWRPTTAAWGAWTTPPASPVSVWRPCVASSSAGGNARKF